jgi:hypothetical protein
VFRSQFSESLAKDLIALLNHDIQPGEKPIRLSAEARAELSKAIGEKGMYAYNENAI